MEYEVVVTRDSDKTEIARQWYWVTFDGLNIPLDLERAIALMNQWKKLNLFSPKDYTFAVRESLSAGRR
jgi:hypothetical protein